MALISAGFDLCPFVFARARDPREFAMLLPATPLDARMRTKLNNRRSMTGLSGRSFPPERRLGS